MLLQSVSWIIHWEREQESAITLKHVQFLFWRWRIVSLIFTVHSHFADWFIAGSQAHLCNNLICVCSTDFCTWATTSTNQLFSMHCCAMCPFDLTAWSLNLRPNSSLTFEIAEKPNFDRKLHAVPPHALKRYRHLGFKAVSNRLWRKSAQRCSCYLGPFSFSAHSSWGFSYSVMMTVPSMFQLNTQESNRSGC